MTSLDANVLLRFLIGDVPEQTEKAELIITKSKNLYATDVIIFETVFAMQKLYKLDRADITARIRDFLELDNVVFTYYLPQVFQLYEKCPALSIIDCYAATESSVYQNELYTFDKTLASQGGKHIKLL